MASTGSYLLDETTTGAGATGEIYLRENTWGTTPDGILVIAPSDHTGTCSYGCLVRESGASDITIIATTTGGSPSLIGGNWKAYSSGMIQTIAYASGGPSGSGALFKLVSSCTPDNITCWKDAASNYWQMADLSQLNVLQAGADNTGATDATTAWNTTCAAAVAITLGNRNITGHSATVNVPNGTYALTNYSPCTSYINYVFGNVTIVQSAANQPAVYWNSTGGSGPNGILEDIHFGDIGSLYIQGHQTSGTPDGTVPCFKVNGTTPGTVYDSYIRFYAKDCYETFWLGGNGTPFDNVIDISQMDSLGDVSVIVFGSYNTLKLFLMGSASGIVHYDGGTNNHYESITSNGQQQFKGNGTRIDAATIESWWGARQSIAIKALGDKLDFGIVLLTDNTTASYGMSFNNAGPTSVHIGTFAEYGSTTITHPLDLGMSSGALDNALVHSNGHLLEQDYNDAEISRWTFGGNCQLLTAAFCPTNSALKGTFTLPGTKTPVSVSNNLVRPSSQINITLKTPGGTIGAAPTIQTITPEEGFTVSGSTSDTSIYNYAIKN